MDDHASFIVKGDRGNFLKVVVLAVEGPVSDDRSPERWLSCTFEVSVDGFRGSAPFSCATFELASLGEQLNRLLALPSNRVTGSARFDTMEPVLSFEVNVNHLGQVIVSGEIHLVNETGIELRFSYASELSYIVELDRQVVNVSSRIRV